MPNIYEPDLDVEHEGDPYVWRRAMLGRQAGSERLGASLFRLPPGSATFPLHAHLHNEELLIVIAGTPTLRTSSEDDGRVLRAGDVVAFLAGLAGAHQLRNDSPADVSLLIVSTMLAPEVNVFPDTGELWVRDYIPGTDAPTDAFDLHAPLPDAG
jgi:uncharacterized cupin superfamily protein